MKDFLIASQLMRLDRPVGFFLLIWPCLWSLWLLQDGRPNSMLIFWIIIGAIIARSAGCVINDICDSDIDAKVKRTSNRPLALGLWTRRQALLLFSVLLLMLALLALHLHVVFTGIIAFILMSSYPMFKRFFFAPQVWLGINWAWSVLVVAEACKIELSMQVFWLCSLVFFWTIAFDTLYAITDREYDKSLHINSMALWLGQYDLLGICIFYILMLVSWLFLANTMQHSKYLLLGAVPILGFVGVILNYCRARDPSKCFQAFRWNNYLGSYFWLLIVMSFG